MTKKQPLSKKAFTENTDRGYPIFVNKNGKYIVPETDEFVETSEVKKAISRFVKQLKSQEKENCGSLYLNDIEGALEEEFGKELTQ